MQRKFTFRGPSALRRRTIHAHRHRRQAKSRFHSPSITVNTDKRGSTAEKQIRRHLEDGTNRVVGLLTDQSADTTKQLTLYTAHH